MVSGVLAPAANRLVGWAGYSTKVLTRGARQHEASSLPDGRFSHCRQPGSFSQRRRCFVHCPITNFTFRAYRSLVNSVAWASARVCLKSPVDRGANGRGLKPTLHAGRTIREAAIVGAVLLYRQHGFAHHSAPRNFRVGPLKIGQRIGLAHHDIQPTGGQVGQLVEVVGGGLE